jgi:L-threonylcarbamoyladenylate synthase
MILQSRQNIEKNEEFFINEIKKWKIFIYPTDTVLWIWCIVDNIDNVDRIYKIKKRDNKPLLQIIPDINWLVDNCDLSTKNLDLIKSKLPWPYSFIVKLKDGEKTIWIRIPNCWFYDLIKKSWLCFITTSVNFSWFPPCTKIWDIPNDISDKVDYIIDDDYGLSWKSSTIIDLTWNEEILIRQ